MGSLFGSKKVTTPNAPEMSPPVEQATFDPTAEDPASKKKKIQQQGKSSLVIARNTGGVNAGGTSAGAGLSA